MSSTRVETPKGKRTPVLFTTIYPAPRTVHSHMRCSIHIDGINEWMSETPSEVQNLESLMHKIVSVKQQSQVRGITLLACLQIHFNCFQFKIIWIRAVYIRVAPLTNNSWWAMRKKQTHPILPLKDVSFLLPSASRDIILSLFTSDETLSCTLLPFSIKIFLGLSFMSHSHQEVLFLVLST